MHPNTFALFPFSFCVSLDLSFCFIFSLNCLFSSSSPLVFFLPFSLSHLILILILSCFLSLSELIFLCWFIFFMNWSFCNSFLFSSLSLLSFSLSLSHIRLLFSPYFHSLSPHSNSFSLISSVSPPHPWFSIPIYLSPCYPPFLSVIFPLPSFSFSLSLFQSWPSGQPKHTSVVEKSEILEQSQVKARAQGYNDERTSLGKQKPENLIKIITWGGIIKDEDVLTFDRCWDCTISWLVSLWRLKMY